MASAGVRRRPPTSAGSRWVLLASVGTERTVGHMRGVAYRVVLWETGLQAGCGNGMSCLAAPELAADGPEVSIGRQSGVRVGSTRR